MKIINKLWVNSLSIVILLMFIHFILILLFISSYYYYFIYCEWTLILKENNKKIDEGSESRNGNVILSLVSLVHDSLPVSPLIPWSRSLAPVIHSAPSHRGATPAGAKWEENDV